MNEMKLMDLMELVFSRTQAEREAYQMMQESSFSMTERETQRQRFCSAFQIIEEAGLESEYEFWCRMNA